MQPFECPFSELRWISQTTEWPNETLIAEYSRVGITLGPGFWLHASVERREMSIVYQSFVYDGQSFVEVRYVDIDYVMDATLGMIAQTWRMAQELFRSFQQEIPREVWQTPYCDLAV